MATKPEYVTSDMIRLVMSALGKRNKGKPKAMTPAERLQRSNAGKASAIKRGFTLPPAPRPETGLAQSERDQANGSKNGKQD